MYVLHVFIEQYSFLRIDTAPVEEEFGMDPNIQIHIFIHFHYFLPRKVFEKSL